LAPDGGAAGSIAGMYILLILEILLRMLVGHMKQVTLRYIPA